MNEKSKSALREEVILKFWEENKIFEKSLEKDSPKGNYVFYEGPPTANGKPGIHHLESRAFKDTIPRYKTMCGYHVRRKGGWDTHGLPVELQVEKKLGLSSKKAIEDYGIAKFNKECKKSVWEYTELWEKFTKRIGFWIDQKNSYVTYHNDYMESVWNVIKEADKQKLLYKDYKVVPWCPRCGTTLSSHELAQGYEDVKDLSVTAKFCIVDASHSLISSRFTPEGPYTTQKSENTTPIYILAWTTTPWTLPGNVALAVGEKIDYVIIKLNDEYLILAKSRLSIIEEEYKIVEEIKGKDLIGLEYEPLYPYLSKTISEPEKSKLNKAFKVYGANFVTTDDGTGIVHTAVMYGQDDFELGTEIGLPKYHMVGLDGKFLSGTDFLEGRFVRDEEVSVDIIKDLAHRGLLFKKERYQHSYPHCWRCHTALIYYARDSWYIKMSALRDKLIKENKEINWEPEYIKEGRFGEWLREVKDWAISRERYWGTPLPVWICDKCGKKEVIGSISQLKSKTKKSGNRYFVMRHGESESNVLEILSSKIGEQNRLTNNGKDQVKESSKKFKEKIDLIIASPLLRTKETIEIFKRELSLKIDTIFDDRLKEIDMGILEGQSINTISKICKSEADRFIISPENGECLNDVKIRVGEFLYELESKYKNKNILIVSHGDPIWMMHIIEKEMNIEQAMEFSKNNYPENAEIKKLDFIPIPHNENYELDLHKPFIDEIKLTCSCGGNLIREKEVMDVWLDSGTMPFSQDHYPFENKDFIDKGDGYPADFISEAIDQTRGWFYTLHAVGILMNKGKAYKNVVCLGHILDAKGKKMSKSIGNIVDPWTMIDKYGVDTLRLWMYSVNQPGESKSFDERTVKELHNKIFNLLYNVLTFYNLYRDKDLEKEVGVEVPQNSNNILDKWILSRLNQLNKEVTKNLDSYKLLEPVRAIREFVDELSTWYVRRSRERLKEGDIEAKKTLYYVLKTLIKLMAPFTPFTSEDIWQNLKNEDDVKSVHIAEWPELKEIDSDILAGMSYVRSFTTVALKRRMEIKINVRQPLKSFSIKHNLGPIPYWKDLEIILADEINVKKIILDSDIENKNKNKNYESYFLDPEITPELKQEGNYRELVRVIQDLRKKKGLNPKDIIILKIEANTFGQELVNKFKNQLIKIVNAKEIKISQTDEGEIKIDKLVFKIDII